MKTKKINVVFEEVKVVDLLVNIGNTLENYMSNFLSLKNHERNTKEILEVRGTNDSNSVHVVLLIDEDRDDVGDETKYVEHCKDFVSQFGKIERCEVETAWSLNKDANEIDGALHYDERYIYG